MELEETKNKYNELSKKFKLPTFKELDEDFEIGKIERDSDCFLRTVRKQMMEKVVNSLGFLEMLLNPVNAPRIYMGYVKSLNSEDRQMIEKIYSILGELSITSIDSELMYSEKKEADLINKIYAAWNAIKPDFKKILENMKKPNIISKKEKSYFG